MNNININKELYELYKHNTMRYIQIMTEQQRTIIAITKQNLREYYDQKNDKKKYRNIS